MLSLLEIVVLLVASGSLMLAFMAITLHYASREMLSAVRLCLQEAKPMKSLQDECARLQSDLQSLREQCTRAQRDMHSQEAARSAAARDSARGVAECAEMRNGMAYLASLVRQSINNMYHLVSASTQIERRLEVIEHCVGIDSQANGG